MLLPSAMVDPPHSSGGPVCLVKACPDEVSFPEQSWSAEVPPLDEVHSRGEEPSSSRAPPEGFCTPSGEPREEFCTPAELCSEGAAFQEAPASRDERPSPEGAAFPEQPVFANESASAEEPASPVEPAVRVGPAAAERRAFQDEPAVAAEPASLDEPAAPVEPASAK